MSKKSGKKSSGEDFQKDLKNVAQKVWLAGLGALSAAEEEGSKLFKKLIARGQEFEEKNRPWVEQAAQRARVQFEETTEAAKSRLETVIEDTSKAVDDKLSSTFERLGVPAREEIQRLTRRVEDLNAKIEALGAKAPKPAAAKKPRASKPEPKPAPKPPAAKAATGTTSKPRSKKAAS